jgi:hypothetical protein
VQPSTRERVTLKLNATVTGEHASAGNAPHLAYKLIDTGSVQRVKIGRRAFITQASVDAFVGSLTAA